MSGKPGNLSSSSIAIWRMVRDSGTSGLTPDLLASHFNFIGGQRLADRLKTLRLAGYLLFDRSGGGRGVWRIGDQLPIGERRRIGAQSFIAVSQAAPCLPRPSAAFNSIWAFAAQQER